MATTVGTEHDLHDLISNLIVLEHDAIAAYESTTEKLSDPTLSAHVEGFRLDHLQHLTTLQDMAVRADADAPQEGDAKQILTTGKVALASLMGDASILKAMKTNEDDTVAAYERAADHPQADAEQRAFFQSALADERRHRTWMEENARAA